MRNILERVMNPAMAVDGTYNQLVGQKPKFRYPHRKVIIMPCTESVDGGRLETPHTEVFLNSDTFYLIDNHKTRIFIGANT